MENVYVRDVSVAGNLLRNRSKIKRKQNTEIAFRVGSVRRKLLPFLVLALIVVVVSRAHCT